MPLAAGEQFGELRDGNLPLVEKELIDFLRSTIPNVGGITGFRKLAVLCEAHGVAMVPHFTPPIATAAVVAFQEWRVSAETSAPADHRA